MIDKCDGSPEPQPLKRQWRVEYGMLVYYMEHHKQIDIAMIASKKL